MPGNRPWRKLLKKLQRQRRRQKYAQKRDKQAANEESKRQADPVYQQWLEQQAQLEEFQSLATKRQQQDEEEAWLRREALAQRQFRIDEAKRLQQEAEFERLRAQQAAELEAHQQEQRQRREESKKLAEQAAAEFEVMMQRMQDYLDNREQQTPSELQRHVETNPGEKLCEFFTKTNCCRFGHACTYNHRRPMLASILLIRHFFRHALLRSNVVHKEYATADAHLEHSEQDLRSDYDEFFTDVLPELEKFGKVLNFRAVRNTLEHLRGHVFVEYENKRSALRAFISLQGRYYASRRLSVEFSNLKTWRGAVCGLSLTRKCPKGFSCGYLHLFRNPNNLYNVNLEQGGTQRSERLADSSKTTEPQTPSWNDKVERSRNWRWSESPEMETSTNSKGDSYTNSKPNNFEDHHKPCDCSKSVSNLNCGQRQSNTRTPRYTAILRPSDDESNSSRRRSESSHHSVGSNSRRNECRSNSTCSRSGNNLTRERKGSSSRRDKSCSSERSQFDNLEKLDSFVKHSSNKNQHFSNEHKESPERNQNIHSDRQDGGCSSMDTFTRKRKPNSSSRHKKCHKQQSSEQHDRTSSGSHGRSKCSSTNTIKKTKTQSYLSTMPRSSHEFNKDCENLNLKHVRDDLSRSSSRDAKRKKSDTHSSNRHKKDIKNHNRRQSSPKS